MQPELSLFRPDRNDASVVQQRLPLPDTVYDVYNNPVSLVSLKWRINTVGTRKCWINWKTLPELSGDLLYCLKLFLTNSIERLAPITASNQFERIKDVIQSLGEPLCELKDIDEVYCRRARTALIKNSRGYQFCEFRAWYLWIANAFYDLADQDLAAELASWSIEGNLKGVAVLTSDPDGGPFSDQEFGDIVRALRHDVSGSLPAIAVGLLVELGANAKNLVLLEERDLMITKTDARKQLYSLEVPRIKKGKAFRETKLRSISTALGRSIEVLIEQNRQMHGGPNPKRPILCMKKGRMMHELTPTDRFKFHFNGDDLADAIKRFASQHNLWSVRSGSALYLTPRRFRYTYACRMAAQGASPSVLATLMDHTDLQNVMVYYRASPDVADRLEKAAESKAIPIWRRFQGIVVDENEGNSEKAIPGAMPTYKNLGKIGYCGRSAICNLYPPLSCYICPSFQAWREAPHQEVLGELEKHERELTRIGNNNPSNRLPHQLREVMDAVRDLIARLATDI